MAPGRQIPHWPRWWTGTGLAGAIATSLALAGLPGCGPSREGSGDGGRHAETREEPIPAIRPVTASEAMRFVGSARCVACHPEQAPQLDTHHARTLARAGSARDQAYFRRPSRVRDLYLGMRYRTEERDGQCRLVASDRREVVAVEAEWAFGSAKRGVTYTGTFQGRPVELHLSYYDEHLRWEVTPGQEAAVGSRPMTPAGRPLEPEPEALCFQCHSTALIREGRRVQPQRSLPGVGCEACHGPGAGHVGAVERGEPDLRIARLSRNADRISIELCGQCHRNPTTSDPRDAGTASHLARFQGLALSMSACFQKSAGRLSCMSCHDPHRDAAPAEAPGYNQVCSSCHGPAARPARPACPRAPDGDCVSCHMPAQTVRVPTRPRFRTHWIRVWEESASGETVPPQAAGSVGMPQAR